MPLAKNLIEAAGNATQANYIEDVFSTYLYTGNDSTQTITNNIDLSTKGGLVWMKKRDGAPYHVLCDTARGVTKNLYSNATDAQATTPTALTAFNTNGFSLGSSNGVNGTTSGTTYVSWTFRKQPKFFDVVTYTGTGSAQTIAHNLGATPGCMIVKQSSASGQSWVVYHKDMQPGSPAYNYFMYLNATDGNTGYSFWNSTAPTSTDFTVGTANQINQSGQTYVAYLFASDAGGFGASGSENVITCGTYTGTGTAGLTVSLGYEPQWVLIKKSNGADYWYIEDNMRGMPTTPGNTSGAALFANDSMAEYGSNVNIYPTATGFVLNNTNGGLNASGGSYIYIAIRRGPMKVPTDGTKVFASVTSSATTGTITSGFPTDLVLSLDRTTGSTNFNRMAQDRLRGAFNILDTSATTYEFANTSTASFTSNTGAVLNGGSLYANGFVHQQFRRAPSFFDEVCYTGTGSAGTKTHNLGVAPELVIIKKRSATGQWLVGVSFTATNSKVGLLSYDYDLGTATYGSGEGFSGQPTSTTISLGTDTSVNASGSTYVAYLFATCAGVSKVGSYTGTGSTQTIDCGFAAGARFVLVKATSTTGNWIVVDTARGLVSGNDPTLLLNSTAAEVTTNDWFDPYSAGFELSSAGGNLANTNGVSYIFLAIA